MQNTQTMSPFNGEEFRPPERVGTPSQAGSKSCHHCGSELQSCPERSEGDWCIQCLDCGAKNIVIHVLQVIGWRS